MATAAAAVVFAREWACLRFELEFLRGPRRDALDGTVRARMRVSDAI